MREHQQEIDENDEGRLVAAAKRGNRDAFGELIERHTNKVFHITWHITRNREDAEDAVQDSFASALVHLRDFDGRSRFSTWLTRIAINAALMNLRKKRRLHEVALEQPVEQGGLPPHYNMTNATPNPEEQYAERERSRILREAIVELRPRLRETVELHQRQGSVEETAEILGISIAATKGRLFHARTSLCRTRQIKAMVNRAG